jgi:hypothetical protein
MGAARAMPPRTPARAAQPLPQARQATDLPASSLVLSFLMMIASGSMKCGATRMKISFQRLASMNSI